MTREEMVDWLKLHKHITGEKKQFESDYAQGCLDGYGYAEMHLNSRTCENCKYYSLDEKPDLWLCNKHPEDGWLLDNHGSMVYGFFYPDKDFGCNKWEAKQ